MTRPVIMRRILTYYYRSLLFRVVLLYRNFVERVFCEQNTKYFLLFKTPIIRVVLFILLDGNYLNDRRILWQIGQWWA